MKTLINNKNKVLLAFEAEALPLMDHLYNTAVKVTRDRNDAEDLVQETYFKAWGSFESFKSGTSFRSWVFRILMNTYINGYNRKKRAPFGGDFDVVSRVSAQEKTVGTLRPSWQDRGYYHIFDDEICIAFDHLPEPFRIVVLMADVNELSYKEIAAVLHVPIGTVMSRLNRGRKLMVRYLSRTETYRHRASLVA